MFPSFPNMTALTCFGLPLLALAALARSIYRERGALRSGAITLAIVASRFGAVGMFPGAAQSNCIEEWTGLVMASLALGLSAVSGFKAGWKSAVLFLLAAYLTGAWGLLVTGCRQPGALS
jgi:hypothetical protein